MWTMRSRQMGRVVVADAVRLPAPGEAAAETCPIYFDILTSKRGAPWRLGVPAQRDSDLVTGRHP